MVGVSFFYQRFSVYFSWTVAIPVARHSLSLLSSSGTLCLTGAERSDDKCFFCFVGKGSAVVLPVLIQSPPSQVLATEVLCLAASLEHLISIKTSFSTDSGLPVMSRLQTIHTLSQTANLSEDRNWSLQLRWDYTCSNTIICTLNTKLLQHILY